MTLLKMKLKVSWGPVLSLWSQTLLCKPFRLLWVVCGLKQSSGLIAVWIYPPWQRGQKRSIGASKMKLSFQRPWGVTSNVRTLLAGEGEERERESEQMRWGESKLTIGSCLGVAMQLQGCF